MKAQEQGLARVRLTWNELYEMASEKIGAARAMVGTLMAEGLIPPVPEG